MQRSAANEEWPISPGVSNHHMAEYSMASAFAPPLDDRRAMAAGAGEFNGLLMLPEADGTNWKTRV